MILPGATLGMLGGGQLGRMFTVAARTLGYRVMVLDPDPDSPAGRIADEHIHAAYSDTWALEQLGKSCAVVTTEFENISADVLRRLSEYCPVRPSASAVEIAQNRIREKTFIRDNGLATAEFATIISEDDIAAACEAVNFPAILKRAELGYDGKGQVVVEDIALVASAFSGLGKLPCVLEEKIDLEKEISVILGRNVQGESQCFPIAENVHRQGILHSTTVPASVSQRFVEQAETAAIRLADALDFCGVMAVEFFISTSGDLLVNEIAPRTHNSGHYTLDACVTCQFEQQVRMVCGLPFGDTRLLSPVTMINLLGDVWQEGSPPWSVLLSDPTVKLHLYGKQQARPGRKMGHFNYLGEDRSHAEKLFSELSHGNG